MTPNDIVSVLRALGRLEEKLDEITVQVKKTNGRVSDLEISRATERGAALQRAATIEDVRVTRAADLARNAWIRPGLVAVAVVVLDAALRHLN